MPFKKTYNDQQLIKGCRDNHRQAQEALYRRFAPKMLRMCYRHTSDEHTALEIVNTGMLKVFQKIDSFQQTGSLEGWIRRIVYRCMADHFRGQKQKIRFLALDERDKEKDRNALDDLYLEDLFHLIESLPEMIRQVFQLYAIEGYTHKEIADILNIKEGTSKWYLSEARRTLKQLVQLHNNQKNYAG